MKSDIYQASHSNEKSGTPPPPRAYQNEEKFATTLIKMNYERGVAMRVESAKMEIRHHFVGGLLSADSRKFSIRTTRKGK